MDLSQAIECASAFVFPGFLADDASLAAERSKNEEALAVLRDAWSSAEPGHEPFGYDLIMSLADRNRDVCDRYGIERLRDASSPNLARKLSDADLVRACAALQHRPVEQVAALAGQGAADLNVAYVDAPVSGMVMGIDIETTDRDPARGYIINVGLEFMTIESGRQAARCPRGLLRPAADVRREGRAAGGHPQDPVVRRGGQAALPREQGHPEGDSYRHVRLPLHGPQRGLRGLLVHAAHGRIR